MRNRELASPALAALGAVLLVAPLCSGATPHPPGVPLAPVLVYQGHTFTDACPSGGAGDDDGVADPGEVVSLTVTVENAGDQTATSVLGTLTTPTAGVTVLVAGSPFPDVAPGGSGANQVPFVVGVGPAVACGTSIQLELLLHCDQGDFTVSFTRLVGSLGTWVPLVSESFDAVGELPLPLSWSSVVVTPIGAPLWTVEPGSTSPMAPPYSPPNLVRFNSHDVAIGGEARLQCELPVDLNPFAAARVRFQMLHDADYPGSPDTAQVVVSTDAGVTWAPAGPPIQRFVPGPPGTVLWQEHVVDLTPYAGPAAPTPGRPLGKPVIRIGINGFSGAGNDEGLDDVAVEAAPPVCTPCSTCVVTCDGSADPSSGYEPLTVAFTGTYTATGCTGATTFLWQFGDGQTSAQQSPGHLYQSAGSYGWTFAVSADSKVCTDSGSVTVDPVADLSLVKADGPDPVRPGQELTYGLTVSNAGPSTASNVVVTDTLPTQATFVSADGTGWSCGHVLGTVTCTRSGLAAGAPASTIWVHVLAPGDPGVLTNTAGVSSDTHDPDPADNSAGASTVVASLDPASLVVDARAGTGSDANGVVEAGETVAVEPAWHNPSAVPLSGDGTLGNPVGPGGALYSIPDATAGYGTVAPGTTASCFDAGGCYQVLLGEPAQRPGVHWDFTIDETLASGEVATWTLHVGESFTDVTVANQMYRFVETLLHTAVTAGCTATTYCPTSQVTRAQMATFIARAMAGSDAAVPFDGSVPGEGPYSCTSGGTSLFDDVAPTASYCRHVHYVYAREVTAGCGATTYCPGSRVTRAQMAMFIARAMAGSDAAVPADYTDPVTARHYDCGGAPPTLYFTDVAAGALYCRHAHYLWARAVVDGCGATTYCPSGIVNRAAMAKFLTNGFSLVLYGP